MTCKATGGTLSTGFLTGPGLGGEGLQLQSDGDRTGQNTYLATSDTLSNQSNGVTYTCTAMNSVSSQEISTAELEGNPTKHPFER